MHCDSVFCLAYKCQWWSQGCKESQHLNSGLEHHRHCHHMRHDSLIDLIKDTCKLCIFVCMGSACWEEESLWQCFSGEKILLGSNKVLRLQSSHIVLTRLLLDGYSWGLFLHTDQKRGWVSQLSHNLWLPGDTFCNSFNFQSTANHHTVGIEMPHKSHVTGGSPEKGP